MKTLIIASNNKGKIREIKELLGDKFDVKAMGEIGISADPEETGSTFAENALIKAKAVYELCRLPVIADDSGLAVNALGGAPGVYSARYAGKGHDDSANNAKLLENLEGITDRTAKFVSSVVYYDGERTETADGTVEGYIVLAPSGKGGFGYDPLFYSTELGKTFGDATDEEKNTVSHRFRAFSALAKKI